MGALTDHFVLAEFERSDVAARMGIDNTVPDSTILGEVQKTAEMLERIRALLLSIRRFTGGIEVTSGYRCPALNRAIKGAANSDHMKGMAVDWKAAGYGTPFDLATVLSPRVDELGIGQLIYEFGSPAGGGWVHCSTRIASGPNRILTIDARGTRVGIVR